MSDHITRVREQAREFNEKLPGGSFADGAAWLASRLTREKIAEVLHSDECPEDPDEGDSCGCDGNHYMRQGEIVLALLWGGDRG